MADAPASRHEVDVLRRRLDTIDTYGTRGVAPLAAQVAQLVKDVAALRSEWAADRADHLALHEKGDTARRAVRRWGWTIALSAAGTVVAVIAMLADIIARLHS